MSLFHAIILGLLQGLTEFLPISSSGHLVIVQQVFKIDEANIAFDILLHFGSLVAVVIYYWKDILALISDFFSLIVDIVLSFKGRRVKIIDRSNPHRILLIMILVGSIPTAIIGIVFSDLFKQMFETTRYIGFALLITGGLLYVSNHMLKGRKKSNDITYTDALTIGLLQGMAITPGISRSGSTIFAGLFRGFNRELAVRFSFLLSLPSIVGAVVLEGKDVFTQASQFQDFLPIAIGFLTAAISGFYAIKLVNYVLRDQKFQYFSYYCWVVGVLVIVYSFV